MNSPHASGFALLFEQLLEGCIDDVSRARLIGRMRDDRSLCDEAARQLVMSDALARIKSPEDDEFFVKLATEHVLHPGRGWFVRAGDPRDGFRMAQ